MGTYAYEAIDKSGGLITGQVEADHEQSAAEQLRRTGLTVTGLDPVRVSPFQGLFKLRRKVRTGDLSLFSRQLAAMLNAGIPLTRVLFTLSQQVANPGLREAVGDVARKVEGGTSFSEALDAHSDVFPYIYVSLIRAGEVGGTLEEVLQRLSEQLEQDKALQDNIRSATFYPITVLCFATVVLLGMLLFIVPVFKGFFPEGMALPLPTAIIMAVSDSLRQGWFLWLLAIVVLAVGTRFYVRSPSGKQAWDRAKFRIPVFGSLIHRAVVARFARTFSTLLAGGIPVLRALETAGPATGSVQMADAIVVVGEKIQEGQSIATPMEASGLFPPMVTHMVAVGEETGELPVLLGRVAEFYEAEVATMTKGLTALIEPLMIIFVGVVVGMILVAMYLPIFMVVVGGT